MCFWTGIVGAILWHELAHAAAARALGMPVRHVQLGLGRPRWERSWRGVKWVLGEKPNSGGFVYVKLGPGARGRRCYMAMIGAAPVANLAVVAVGFALLWGPNAILPWAEWEWWAVIGLIMANGLVFFGAFRRDDAPIPGQIASSDFEKFALLWHFPRLYDYWQLAQEAAEKGPTPPGDYSSCDALNVAGRHLPHAEMTAIFRELVEASKASLALRLAWIDQYCTWALFTGDVTIIAGCAAWADELFAHRGKEYTVWGTQGSIQLFTGRVEESVALLERLMAEDEAPLDRAIAGACLAYAAHQRGDGAARERWWSESLRANSGRPAITWIAGAIGAQSSNTSV